MSNLQPVNEIAVLEHMFKHDMSKGIWFSEILRATGSNDKPRIVKILRNLRRAGLIESDKKWKMGTKKILKLTQIGLELYKLMDNLKKIRKYSEMLSHWNIHLRGDKIFYGGGPQESIEEQVLITGPPEKLRKIYYDHWTNGLAFIHEQMEKHIFLSLIYWYGNTTIKFKPNETAMRIIQAVVVDRIKKELDLLIGRWSKIGNQAEEASLIRISEPIYKDITDIYYKDFFLSSSQFLKDLVSKYIDSLSSIADVTSFDCDYEGFSNLVNESNWIINSADPEDLFNEKVMKAKDNLELVKIA